MKQHYKFSFLTSDDTQKEILTALLSNSGFEGFEEEEQGLNAYILKDQFDRPAFDEIVTAMNVAYTEELVDEQNWNAIWESGFEPVSIPGFCTVRAGFHPQAKDTPYEIVITPKMSFGTGHHSTTMLMMQEMQHIDFNGKTVFDFGTGTGILAILASMLEAQSVLAVDNDEWSYENTIENVAGNRVENVTTVQGSVEVTNGRAFEVILANINKNILLQYMQDLYRSLTTDGVLLMSGLLTNDESDMLSAAQNAGFVHLKTAHLNGWIVLRFSK